MAVTAALAFAVAGCATGMGNTPADVSARPATGLPAAFQAGEGATCRNPLTDPADGTRLTLMRSQSGRGDYAVPTGKYGVGEGELLRIECASGRAVGIVRR